MGYVSTLRKIQEAFEQAGIQFINEDEVGGFGVRMAKKKKKAIAVYKQSSALIHDAHVHARADHGVGRARFCAL